MTGTHVDFFIDICIIMIVASIIILIFHKLKQPTVLGYILSGILIGPHMPFVRIVHNMATIETIAELGIIVLMFSLGLTFSFSKLKKIGGVSAIAGTLVIISMISIGYLLGLAFGWCDIDAFFLGTMIAISSTAIITKSIFDRNAVNQKSSQIIFGFLIVEDIAAVIILTMISGISITGEIAAQGMIIAILNVAIFMLLFISIGFLAVPKVIKYTAKSGSRELFLITALGMCFGFSLLGYALGFSLAIGAFLAGAVMGECPEGKMLSQDVRPLKDMFSAIFFISIGMLFDPTAIFVYWLPIVVITVVFLVAKTALASISTFFFGMSAENALKIGLTMGVIGEFSYIIARQGYMTGVTSTFLYPIILTASILTLVINTYVNRNTAKTIKAISRRMPISLKRYAAFITLSLNHFKVHARSSGHTSREAKQYLRDIMMNVTIIMLATLILRLSIINSLPLLTYLGLSQTVKMPFIITLSILAMVIIITAFVTLLRAIFKLIDAVSLPTYASFNKARLRKDTLTYQVFKALVLTCVVMGATVIMAFIATSYISFSPLYLVIFVVMALAISYFFHRSVELFNTRIKKMLMDGLERSETLRKSAEDGEYEQKKDLPISSLLLSGDNLQNLTIDRESRYAGKKLAETDIRRRYQSSVIGIQRRENLIINPAASERIIPGDVLILLGSRVRVKRN